MAKRQERFGLGDSDETKPRSKRRADKPAKGYKPSGDQDNFGSRKNMRRPDEEDDDFLDLEDEEFEDEDFEEFDDEDFEDEDFEDGNLEDLDDPDDLL